MYNNWENLFKKKKEKQKEFDVILFLFVFCVLYMTKKIVNVNNTILF